MNFLLGMSQTRAYATPRKQYSTVLGRKTGREEKIIEDVGRLFLLYIYLYTHICE